MAKSIDDVLDFKDFIRWESRVLPKIANVILHREDVTRSEAYSLAVSRYAADLRWYYVNFVQPNIGESYDGKEI